jgi:putative hydrolase of the HAD superfamily
VDALAACDVVRSREDVAAAFAAEARYYRARAHLGRDVESLAALRRECVAVFLDELGAGLAPEAFVDAFIGSLVFHPVAGAVETLERLSARIRLAVVANWDSSLHEHLERLGLDRYFDVVVTSAEAGAAKPDPAIFLAALERLDVEPARALHVGDEPIDEQGARAAGMRFLPAPLAEAFAELA